MKHFCIIANEEKDPGGRIAKQIASSFAEKGCRAYVISPIIPGTEYGEVKLEEGTDCAVILGGDGTFLRAAKVLLPYGIPVMGINLGHLGFLTAAEYQDAEKAVEKLVSGEYVIENRSLLTTSFEGSPCGTLALNDVVIARSGFSRLIRLRLSVNGQEVENYQGDGVILATPSGSTGYSLSAGGPVVSPVARTLVITPICPHMLHACPLIVSEDDVITVEVCRSSRSMDKGAQVTVDGDEVLALAVGETVTIEKAPGVVPVVMLKDISFWERVRGKL
ncbi:MAG: NAD(+)/NADH kinase [Lachnospiraceae bacterium]|nr:NAD(+)/NADH kinase [Lachnospiraceae bacterium]